MIEIAVRFFSVAVIVLFALGAAVANTTASPQSFSCAEVTEIPQSECLALVALYNNTSGDSWIFHTDWLVTTTPSSWYGVTVIDGAVTQLSLPNNQLSGSIPVELGNLASLQYLKLSGNQLSGSIPLALGNLANLQFLALYSNQLTGSIPSDLGSLVNLRYLHLYWNQLSGNIPPELGNLVNLVELSLSHNQLSGGIPPDLGNLASLLYLGLNDNQLSGSIPPELGNLANLIGLSLSINQLSGSLPSELGNLANLQNLFLNFNQLSGNIPSEFGNLANLQWLYLNSNQMAGSIPPELSSLANLRYLSLQSNLLSGSIPPQLGNLANLQSLSLSSNNLGGCIPPELGNLAYLQYLALSTNQLSGSIPSQIGNLTDLVYLFLDHNDLSGPIPPELAQLMDIPDPDAQNGPALTLDHNWFTIPNPYPSEPPTALEIYLMAKDPDWEKTQGVRENIPVTGGEVQSPDGRAAVVIPDGGVTQPVELQLTTLTQPGTPTGSLIFANTSFSLTAYDEDGNPIIPFNFAAPVAMTLYYQDSDIAGLIESQLALYYWDTMALAWKDAAQSCAPASSYQRDLVNNTLRVNVCHLTEFALLGMKNYPILLPMISRH
jgi:Leucine-rich repeat (LRR) protein